MTIKVTLQKVGLKALNDFYLVEEDPIDWEVDTSSGLTKSVVDSLKSGQLVIPQTATYYAKKNQCKGIILDKGPKCKSDEINIGDRVLYPRLAPCRQQQDDGKFLVFIREYDILAKENA